MGNPNCGKCGMLSHTGYCKLTACTYPCIYPCPAGMGGYINKPVTNADRIRQMSDEELAEFICHNVSNGTVNCAFCAAEEFCHFGHNGWLDWLKKEAEDER